MKTHYISRIYHKSKLPQKVLRGFLPSVYNSDSPVSYNAIVLRVVSADLRLAFYLNRGAKDSSTPDTDVCICQVLGLQA